MMKCLHCASLIADNVVMCPRCGLAAAGDDTVLADETEIMKICKSHDCDDLYFAPDIPREKLINLRRTARVPSDVEAYALIDATVFGSAKNGMLITSNGLYIHNDTGGDDITPGPLFLSWRALQETDRSMYPAKLGGIGEVALSDSVNFAFAGCILDKDDVISMVKEFRDCLGAPEEVQQPSPVSSAQPMQKCEYCTGDFPRGLANCPRCGAPAN